MIRAISPPITRSTRSISNPPIYPRRSTRSRGPIFRSSCRRRPACRSIPRSPSRKEFSSAARGFFTTPPGGGGGRVLHGVAAGRRFKKGIWKNGRAGQAVHPPPRWGGGEGGGACNKIEGTCKQFTCALTPSPTLPRKRGRERTE